MPSRGSNTHVGLINISRLGLVGQEHIKEESCGRQGFTGGQRSELNYLVGKEELLNGLRKGVV